jgi:hypothetical protein
MACRMIAISMISEIIPMVDRSYKAAADRESRAIAGLSMVWRRKLAAFAPLLFK